MTASYILIPRELTEVLNEVDQLLADRPLAGPHPVRVPRDWQLRPELAEIGVVDCRHCFSPAYAIGSHLFSCTQCSLLTRSEQ